MKKTWVLTGFILLKFLLQYLLWHPVYELHRDEFLYLDQANHMAWGYLSVPPVTSWISWFISLPGSSICWVKFFPPLFGALTIWFVWKITEELGGNLYALILGATGVLFSALLRINSLYQPNSLDILCWTASLCIVIKYAGSGKSKWLYVASIIFAVGFLNKYNIAFLLIGLLPAILLSPLGRIFLKKEFYISSAIGLLLIAPNLWWQYANNFPVFHHLRELSDTQLVNVSRLDFLRDQLFFFAGALPVILASFYALLFYEPFRRIRFFFPALIIILFLFIWLKAKNYYAIGLYPAYIAIGAVFLGNVLKTGYLRYLKPVIAALPVLFYFLLLNEIFMLKSPEYIIRHEAIYKKLGLLRWEDGKDHALPQDYADMLGWKELSQNVYTVWRKIPDKDNTIILCDNYGEAGAINYYNRKTNLRAISFEADYINWISLNQPVFNVIRVVGMDEKDREWNHTRPLFEKAFSASGITNPFAREYGTAIFVFTHPKIDVNEVLEKELGEKRKFMVRGN